MASIGEQLKKLDQQKRKLLQKQDNVRANRTFLCLCGGRHKFKQCTGIRFWEKSYSSYEDGNWSDAHILCPKTGVINRILFSGYDLDIPYEKRREFDNDLNAQFQRMYAPLLQNVREHHNLGETIHSFEWGNNEHIAENYKRYELRVAYIEEMKGKFK